LRRATRVRHSRQFRRLQTLYMVLALEAMFHKHCPKQMLLVLLLKVTISPFIFPEATCSALYLGVSCATRHSIIPAGYFARSVCLTHI